MLTDSNASNGVRLLNTNSPDLVYSNSIEADMSMTAQRRQVYLMMKDNEFEYEQLMSYKL